MRKASWLLSLGIAVAVATASSAAEERSPLAACGHLEELAAAKRALQDGDQASALIHLRNADALLAQCERDSKRSVEPADAEPADATVVGGAEASPTPSA